MRSPRWLLSLVLFPSLASAQVWGPPPPPHVYIQQRIHWHVRRVPRPPVIVAPAPFQPPMYVAPAPPPVWVAPQTPPPPVYLAPPPAPYVHIEPQQPVYVQPQPIYQQPACCMQAPLPPPPPVVVQPAPVAAAVTFVSPKPQWAARFGLGASVEGVFGRGNDSMRGYGVMGQLRYRTSPHTALELMGGYEKSKLSIGLERADVPFTFGLLIPFLGPDHVFSPYLVAALGLNFAQLRLVDSRDFELDDSRMQGVGQLGAGFEIRLGQRFALNTDARLEGRWNMGRPSDEVQNAVVKVDGQVVDPLKNSVGVRLGVGATVYF